MIVDSNILIELVHHPRSRISEWLEDAQARCRLHINHLIFAEISPNFATFGDLESFLGDLEIAIEPLTLPECHHAGQAFAEYRRRGGGRETILPDFLIGAQAEMRRWPLVTRDRKGFASYFSELEILDPTKQEE